MKNKDQKLDKKKMTIEEYEDRYVKYENTNRIKFSLSLLITLVAIVLFTCLLVIVEKVYNINQYAGYVAAVIALIIYIVFFIVPTIKILKSDYFITNVNANKAKEAKNHNKKARKNIAKKIIELHDSINNIGWYDTETINLLGTALYKNDNELIKDALTKLYNGSVRKSAKKIYMKAAAQSGVASALSQSSSLDTALVLMINVQMIKDIIFLYGFRPSEAKLMKIVKSVLRSALIAYGVSSVDVGKILNSFKVFGKFTEDVPILGSITSSALQALTNGMLTVKIGRQTQKYLMYEYKLQDLLDGIVLGNEEEEQEEYKEIAKIIREKEKKEKENGKSKVEQAE